MGVRINFGPLFFLWPVTIEEPSLAVFGLPLLRRFEIGEVLVALFAEYTKGAWIFDCQPFKKRGKVFQTPQRTNGYNMVNLYRLLSIKPVTLGTLVMPYGSFAASWHSLHP